MRKSANLTNNRLADPSIITQSLNIVERAGEFGLDPKEKLRLLPDSVLRSMHTWLAQKYNLAPHEQRRFEVIASVMRERGL